MNFTDSNAFIERECLLFEPGEYPERGLSVSLADLQKIVQNSPSQLPVHIEHLQETPFDGALGFVENLSVRDGSLWGLLRQPLEAWNFVKRAGARSLSVALDIAAHKLTEVSFVCHPRIASAQVFSINQPPMSGEEMNTVKQFAEGLIQYLRGVAGGDSTPDVTAAAAFSAEREAFQAERIDHQIMEFKRRGLMRATPQAEALARSILQNGASQIVQFNGETRQSAGLFSDFLEANGTVISMGESIPADPGTSVEAGERLVALARSESAKSGLPFAAAFSKVSAQNLDLSASARA